MAAVRAGDLNAYAALYSAHVGAVRTVVRSQVSDPVLAEDVVQDVFVRALESLERLDDPERFRPWLMSIARHTAIDARRRVSRSRETADDGAEAADVAGGVEPELRAELAELSSLMWGVVAGLSERDATAMALVSLGFGVADVAVALDIDYGAAKVALHRARERTRTAVMVEVLVRGQGPSCEELPRDDVVSAARHLRGCRRCAEAARAAISHG